MRARLGVGLLGVGLLALVAANPARSASTATVAARTDDRPIVFSSFGDDGYVTILSPKEFPETSPANGTPVRIVNRFSLRSARDHSLLGKLSYCSLTPA